jgi:hypothetical protein
MGGGFDHPPGVTSGTDAATFARPGDEKIVTALGASGARKTIGENAAFEIAAELASGGHRARAWRPGSRRRRDSTRDRGGQSAEAPWLELMALIELCDRHSATAEDRRALA